MPHWVKSNAFWCIFQLTPATPHSGYASVRWPLRGILRLSLSVSLSIYLSIDLRERETETITPRLIETCAKTEQNVKMKEKTYTDFVNCNLHGTTPSWMQLYSTSILSPSRETEARDRGSEPEETRDYQILANVIPPCSF